MPLVISIMEFPEIRELLYNPVCSEEHCSNEILGG